MRKRFTQEFKQDVVSQVTDKGFPVVEVAERLGVSSHSHRPSIAATPPLSATRTDLVFPSEPSSTSPLVAMDWMMLH